MHEPAVSSPGSLRDVLIDDVLRRHYILDADVVEHTAALASVDPATNQDGKQIFQLFYLIVWLHKCGVNR